MTTNGQLSDTEARRLSGDGKTTPPGPRSSTSEGDLRKGSYRQSKWNRLATHAVANDDGTPVAAGVEELLNRLVTLTEALEQRETDIGGVVTAIETGQTEGSASVRPVPFDTGWIALQGILTASIYTAGDVIGDPMVITGLPKHGRIETVRIIDEDKEEISSNLAIFNELPADVDDHDIFVVAQGDLTKQIDDIPITNADYSTYSSSSFASVGNLGKEFNAPEKQLIVYWVTRGTPTIAASKVMLVRFLGISMDDGE